MKRVMVAVMALLVPVAALAQESTAPAAEDKQPERKHIQVLQDPHDISSFYRSDAGPRYQYVEPGYGAPVMYRYRAPESSGWTTYGRGGRTSPYELSSFYRSEPAAHPAMIVMPRGGSCGR